jgi:para-aminobenzoate synthetase component 1
MEGYLHREFNFTGDAFDLLSLFRGERHVFLLDSSQQEFHRGRYSFIGFDPFDVFVHQGIETLALLRKKFVGYAGGRGGGWAGPFSPLTAGVVGCLSYDYGLRQEKIRLQARDDLNLPDCFFGFYDCILTVDHVAQKLYITSSGLPETAPYLREKRASERLTRITRKIIAYLDGTLRPKQEVSDPISLIFQSNFSEEQYRTAVEKALGYIGRGDIYQVNLSQRFECDLGGRAFDVLRAYRMLRHLSPSPFGGYLDGGPFQLISNSPEQFLCLRNRRVQTRPMKGTRPRGEDGRRDRELREEILNSPKEKAELLMITDLLRNDLGKVCEYGSVYVKEMRAIEEYPYVFQATSTVEGTLKEGGDAFDLLAACFPGGSVTGCPKIRAMEIIEELEPARRGMYTGSLGYINFDGNLDFNILIRTLLARGEKLYFQAGGGIVADSIPEHEYQETLVKARAIKECLRAADKNKFISTDSSRL